MPPALLAFLRDGAVLPFEWGRRDCALWACEWIARVRGEHPAPDLLGSYDSAMGCARLLREAGGLLVVASRIADAAGMSRVDTPQPGDVVAVRLNARPWLGVALGIRAQTRTIFKAPFGVTGLQAAPLLAWRP